MNWYHFLSGDLAADFNQEYVNREIANVETAFKLYSLHNRKDVWKYSFVIQKDEVSIIRTIVDKNFKFCSLKHFDTPISMTENEDHDPYIYYSAETYIIGYTLDGLQYNFIIFTLNDKTKKVITDKFNEALNMNEALV